MSEIHPDQGNAAGGNPRTATPERTEPAKKGWLSELNKKLKKEKKKTAETKKEEKSSSKRSKIFSLNWKKKSKAEAAGEGSGTQFSHEGAQPGTSTASTLASPPTNLIRSSSSQAPTAPEEAQRVPAAAELPAGAPDPASQPPALPAGQQQGGPAAGAGAPVVIQPLPNELKETLARSQSLHNDEIKKLTEWRNLETNIQYASEPGRAASFNNRADLFGAAERAAAALSDIFDNHADNFAALEKYSKSITPAVNKINSALTAYQRYRASHPS